MHSSFEAVTPGETVELGSRTVERAEMVGFARRYDPQPFHLSAEGDGPFDGVVASGWHTAAVTMRLLVDGYLDEAATVGSPGLDRLRWREPVSPGDTLAATLTLGEKEPWDDERGLVHHEVETRNGDGAVVLSFDALVLYRRRG